MTALDAIAIAAANAQYRAAREHHDLQAIRCARSHKPLTARKESAAARRLARYGPTEVLVISAIASREEKP